MSRNQHPKELAVVIVEPSEPDVTLVTTRAHRTGRSAIASRALDLIIGVPLCLFVFPVVLVLAVVLAFHLGAQPFFVHERIGKNGRRLWLPKLRTLPRDHDPYADKIAVLIAPPSRLTAFLRDTHLDELPQLFLVPIGQMSLVGPRPRMLPEAASCGDDEFNQRRTTVRPGCTGLWQISKERSARVSDSPAYDRLYLESGTLQLDLWILWRTAIETLGAGQIELADVPKWALRR